MHRHIPGDPTVAFPRLGANPCWVAGLTWALAEYHARQGTLTQEQWRAYRALWCHMGHGQTCPLASTAGYQRAAPDGRLYHFDGSSKYVGE